VEAQAVSQWIASATRQASASDNRCGNRRALPATALARLVAPEHVWCHLVSRQLPTFAVDAVQAYRGLRLQPQLQQTRADGRTHVARLQPAAAPGIRALPLQQQPACRAGHACGCASASILMVWQLSRTAYVTPGAHLCVCCPAVLPQVALDVTVP
jgi:hypothetical protein